MRFIQHALPIALFTAAVAIATPASATTDTRVEAFALAPVGNIHQHGLDYGVGYTVAKLGPVRITPLVAESTTFGNMTFHLGAAATVGLGKHVDVGLAEMQRPGAIGFTRIAPSAVVGFHL
jgi:hypothetical protein